MNSYGTGNELRLYLKSDCHRLRNISWDKDVMHKNLKILPKALRNEEEIIANESKQLELQNSRYSRLYNLSMIYIVSSIRFDSL